MRRMAQSRADDEKPLETTGPTGVLGRFVPVLDGIPGYRFEDPSGAVVLAISKPSLKNAVEVVDAAGSAVGTISKVGRLHSRYDMSRPDRKAAAIVKLVSGATDAWEVHIDGVSSATISRTIWSPAGPSNLAGVDYAVSIAGALDDELQRLLLAVPLAIDILDTEVL
jgi:roadblock/LC7 domain-containing protein